MKKLVGFAKQECADARITQGLEGSKGLFVILKSNRKNRKKVLEQRITSKEIWKGYHNGFSLDERVQKGGCG